MTSIAGTAEDRKVDQGEPRETGIRTYGRDRPVIEGEDSAPEAMRASQRMLDATGVGLSWTWPPVGDAALAPHGSRFPIEAWKLIDDADPS